MCLQVPERTPNLIQASSLLVAVGGIRASPQGLPEGPKAFYEAPRAFWKALGPLWKAPQHQLVSSWRALKPVGANWFPVLPTDQDKTFQ